MTLGLLRVWGVQGARWGPSGLGDPGAPRGLGCLRSLMGSWWTQGDPRTPWGLGCLKTPRSWWTQGDPGAPGVWECPRTPGPGAAFLQDCQPCCVEAQPRPPWGPWPRPPWGPWVVSALGPGLWLRHRPSWPQPQDMCPAGPPGQSAWQRCADMPPLPSLQGALLASVLGSSRRRTSCFLSPHCWKVVMINSFSNFRKHL